MSDPLGMGEDFLRQVAGYVQRQAKDQPDFRMRLGTVDYDYDPNDFLGGINPKILFDGERVTSQKRYTVIPPYFPRPGDRVVLAPVGTSYSILGTIGVVQSQPKVDYFTSDDTWTKPVGARYIQIECQAGGGGGGGAAVTGAGQSSVGAGGGGGAYSRRILTANTVGATEAVWVGGGGAGGSGGSTGSQGGGTSFAGWVSADGGDGGGSTGAAASGTGGTFGGNGSVTTALADFTSGGSGGQSAWRDGNRCVAGAGGSSHLGGGGAGQHTSGSQSIAGKAGRIYGGGGSGALASDGGAANTGGAGAPGIVIVTTYFN